MPFGVGEAAMQFLDVRSLFRLRCCSKTLASRVTSDAVWLPMMTELPWFAQRLSRGGEDEGKSPEEGTAYELVSSALTAMHAIEDEWDARRATARVMSLFLQDTELGAQAEAEVAEEYGALGAERSGASTALTESLLGRSAGQLVASGRLGLSRKMRTRLLTCTDGGNYMLAAFYSFLEETADFTGMSLVAALRHFVAAVRLPREAGLVQRAVDAFSMYWADCNRSLVQTAVRDGAPADWPYYMIFSAVMLNTDLHNEFIPSGRRMTPEVFYNLLHYAGGQVGGPLHDIAKGVYEEIAAEQLRSPELDAKLAHERARVSRRRGCLGGCVIC
eukprot:PLAT5407.1.p1 GENE.PLAT5407.1~~PLAT5407.1.p1  ORF type:complete len:366 (+),score=66.86 PLAT5407.1:106-1098(+)